MRKIISSLCFLGVVATTMNSCQKGDVVQDVNSLGQGSYVTLVQKNNLILDATNPAGSKVGVVAQEYGAKQDKVIVYVSKGNATQNRASWKKLKEFPIGTDGQYSIEVTGSEIAAAVGSTLQPGDVYTMYNSCITSDGRVFDFGNTFPEFANNPNYNMVLTWQATVVCPFVPPVAGNYKVIQDDWVDWSPGAIVPVTDGPGVNQVNISQVWPNPAYGDIVNPLYLIVNPATGAATVPVNYTWANNYPGTAATNGAGSGFVFSCTGDILMTIPVSYNGAAQGNLKLILKKQ